MLSDLPGYTWLGAFVLFVVTLAIVEKWRTRRREAREAAAKAAAANQPVKPRSEPPKLLLAPAGSFFEPAPGHNQDEEDLHPERPHAPACVCGADAVAPSPALSSTRFGRSVAVHRVKGKGAPVFCEAHLRVAEAELDRFLRVDVASIYARADREAAVAAARFEGKALRQRVEGSLSKSQRPAKMPKSPASKALHARGAPIGTPVLKTNGAGTKGASDRSVS